MLWLAAAAAIGTLEEDFGTLVEERSLHLDKSAANMWRLYVPSISVTAVNGQTFGDQARDIASAEGWSLEGKSVARGDTSIFIGEEADHTCGVLEIDNGNWKDEALLMSGTGERLLDVDVKLVAGDRHTTLCPCAVGHECVSVGDLPPLCLAVKPVVVSDSSWLVIGLTLTAITVLVYHIWR